MANHPEKVKVATIGAGGWGKNLVRNFYQIGGADLSYVCDLDEGVLAKAELQYPGVKVSASVEDALADSEVQAVVIATPAVTHYEMAKKALQAGKHVFVEKPMTLKVRDARDLAATVEKTGLKLMVGHLLEYHPAVETLREMVVSGELGEIFYAYSQRVNLGVIRKDENALWSFAPHDISVILYLFDTEPETVCARGESYLQQGIEDVVFVNMRFADGKMAQMQLSWLDPHKIRKTTIVGSKKMVVFDDMESAEKVKVYDKGVSGGGEIISYAESFALRTGDIYIPHIKMVEPLRTECEHFIDCIRTDRQPRSDVQDGLRVVEVLAAAQESLSSGGVPVRVAKDS